MPAGPAAKCLDVIRAADAAAAAAPPPPPTLTHLRFALQKLLPDANPANVVRLLVQLDAAKLQHGEVVATAVAQMMSQSLETFAARLSSSELVALLTEVAESGWQPPLLLIRKVLEASELELQSSSVRNAIGVLGLLVRLGAEPPDAWLRAFYTRVASSLQLTVPRFNIASGSSSSSSIHTGATLGWPSSLSGAGTIASVLRSHKHTDSVPGPLTAYDGTVTCMLAGSDGTAAAAARPRPPPPSQEQRDRKQSTFDAMGGLDAQKLSAGDAVNALRDLGRLRAQPPSGWVAAVVATLQPNISSLSAVQLADLCWALYRVSHAPSHRLMDDLLAACRAQFGAQQADQWPGLLRSLGRLNARPGAAWLADCLAALQPLMAGFSSKDLAVLANGLASLGAEPSEQWLAALCGASELLISSMAPLEAARLFHGVAKLTENSRRRPVHPPGPVADPSPPLTAASRRRRGLTIKRLGSRTIFSTSWPIHALHHQQLQHEQAPVGNTSSSALLPSSWLSAMLTALQPLLPQMAPAELTMVTNACSRLGHTPDAPFMSRLLAATAAALDTSGPHELTSILYSLAALKYKPPPSWTAALLGASIPLLPRFSPLELANMLKVGGTNEMAGFGRWFDVLENRNSIKFKSRGAVQCKHVLFDRSLPLDGS